MGYHKRYRYHRYRYLKERLCDAQDYTKVVDSKSPNPSTKVIRWWIEVHKVKTVSVL